MHFQPSLDITPVIPKQSLDDENQTSSFGKTELLFQGHCQRHDYNLFK